jgi:hypothetical protein
MSPRSELDSLVVTMELTLISIIQGVALYWLTDSSRAAISEARWMALPYIAVALCILFQFWSWSLVHTFTIIGWPLEFSHNYFYIGATLLQAVMFTQAGNPQWWYLMGLPFAAVVWLSFGRDMHMVRAKAARLTGPAGRELGVLLIQEQRYMVRLSMPGNVLFYGVAAALMWLLPSFFVERSGHLVLAAMQLVGAIASVKRIALFSRRVAPLVLQSRLEEKTDGIQSSA